MVIETGAVNSTQALAGVISSTREPEAKAPPPESAAREVSIGETFFSPVIKIDSENQTAILQFRDSETGEITKEYPSESVKAYQDSPTPSEKPVKSEAGAKPAVVEKEAVEIQQRAQEDAQAVKPEQGEQPAQDILV